MPEGDRYVTNGALLRCDKGVLVTPLTVLPRPSRVNGQFQATALDCLPVVNIKPFGVCAITHAPCMPVMPFWTQVHAGSLKVGGAPPLLESSVCQCGLGGRIGVTVLPVPGAPPIGPEGAGALAAAQEQQRQQAAQDAAAHELANHAKEQAGKLALLGLACAIGGLFFPPLEIVAVVALEASEAYLVAGVGIDLAVAVDHPTQDNWVTVGGDVLAIATGYVVGKVIVGPALGALANKMAQRSAQKLAAEAEAAAAAEAEAAAAAAAKAQAEMEKDLVAASKKRADDLVAERERIKTANEGVKPKKQEPQTVSSPVTASIADPKLIDPATGKPAIYQGENFNVKSPKGRAELAKFKDEAHPVLKARIEAQDAAFKNGTELENIRSGSNPGAHAEVVAVDKALKAREAAGLKVTDNTINELYLHNRSLLNSQYPNGTPKMCDHCAAILKGINTIGHD